MRYLGVVDIEGNMKIGHEEKEKESSRGYVSGSRCDSGLAAREGLKGRQGNGRERLRGWFLRREEYHMKSDECTCMMPGQHVLYIL
ncbi:hypothetical protein Pmani_025194 [Petrolisthes manimaculis]|uniref:Uncharacterized protein n=1 Tax=Petrolisthes manimaculis TaxID=1843537 RepID=A0AAE1TZ65_9EUCA|nr:hypothetical protein Pmani_025194 [Petrolisthes manimaculis]